MKDSTKAWILATRPKTLPAGLSPVLLATGLAYHHSFKLDSLLILLVVLCVMFLQISSNLINDYYDGLKGTDTEDRLGPTRVTSTGLISPEKVKQAFLTLTLFSFLIGTYLMYHSGLPIVMIGFLSIIGAYAYTAGPFPLSYYALGELMALVYFGPIAVWGTYFILTGSHHDDAVVLGFLPGFISATILGINNLRDTISDKQVGKKTLSTLFGEQRMRKILLLFVTLAQLPIIYLIDESYYYFLAFIPLIFYKKVISNFTTQPLGTHFNQYLAQTGQYLFATCLILTALFVFIP